MFNKDFYFLKVHFEMVYNLFKDHRNPYLQELVTDSYQIHYREEFSSVQWNPVNTDTKGTGQIVRINGVFVLSGVSE